MEQQVAHKQPRYMVVWGALFVLTMIEVCVAFLGLPKTAIVLMLVGLAIWKASLVAMYYMHLKFEPARLIVTVMAPLPLAVILVMLVLMDFR